MDYWEHEYMKECAGMGETLLSDERRDKIIEWLEGMTWWPAVLEEIIRRHWKEGANIDLDLEGEE